jgi:hypothetical protein
MHRRPIDYVALRSLIPPRAVLDLICWQPTQDRGGISRGPCPLTTQDHHGSRALWVTQTGYYCHECHTHGDAVDLWRRLTDQDVYSAALDLCRRLSLAVPYRTTR